MQWLTECIDFMGQRIPGRRSSILYNENERFPNVLVLMREIRRVLESEEERSCLDGEYIIYINYYI